MSNSIFSKVMLVGATILGAASSALAYDNLYDSNQRITSIICNDNPNNPNLYLFKSVLSYEEDSRIPNKVISFLNRLVRRGNTPTSDTQEVQALEVLADSGVIKLSTTHGLYKHHVCVPGKKSCVNVSESSVKEVPLREILKSYNKVLESFCEQVSDKSVSKKSEYRTFCKLLMESKQ